MARRAWCTLLLCVACGQQRSTTPPPQRAEAIACHYDVGVRSEEPLSLEVEARCTGQVARFSAGDAQALPFTAVLDDGGRASPPGALPPASGKRNVLRYRVDMEGLARAVDRFDVAERVGHSLIAPASSFLLVPEPIDIGIPISLDVRAAPGRFTSGLARGADGRYRLQAHEISVATYCVFGSFTSETLDVGASKLEVATLDGELAASAADRRRWISEDAHAVADFYGAFPARHTLLSIIPLPGHQAVDFGKLLPTSAPGVTLVIGAGAGRAALYDDWILVHELFHIGFPSFSDEGKWLDEGSATYFEPIIRARIGQLSEREVWRQFISQMPQGFDAMTRTGLEHATFRGIYWGGALACLIVDVAARRASNGARGLEDAFRAVLAQGGNASEVWSLARVTAVIDRALGGNFLADFSRQHAQSGGPLDADALFGELGVRRAGEGVTLDDGAPLAAIRKAIVLGRK